MRIINTGRDLLMRGFQAWKARSGELPKGDRIENQFSRKEHELLKGKLISAYVTVTFPKQTRDGQLPDIQQKYAAILKDYTVEGATKFILSRGNLSKEEKQQITDAVANFKKGLETPLDE